MPIVKDMPTIKVSVLIAEMQARFQYRVSYRKAWIAKQMAMEQLYGDYDSSYNELQGWIAAMRELATLIPRIGQQQVDQIEAGHVFVKHVRDAMVANRRLARSMNVEIYSRRLETFRVTETISRRPGIPTRSYGVDLQNRQC
ncbi:hypothetical protein GOBAR_DD10123 [Gossypium barbadense]|nr:hypothetical protein GOBAR_DD10123 [Gossypium barbadense]